MVMAAGPYGRSLRSSPMNFINTRPDFGIATQEARRVPPQMSYDEAMGRNMQRDMKSPEEQARINAAINRGPSRNRAQMDARIANLARDQVGFPDVRASNALSGDFFRPTTQEARIPNSGRNDTNLFESLMERERQGNQIQNRAGSFELERDLFKPRPTTQEARISNRMGPPEDIMGRGRPTTQEARINNRMGPPEARINNRMGPPEDAIGRRLREAEVSPSQGGLGMFNRVSPFQGGFGRQPNPFQGGFGRQPNPFQGGFGRQQPNPFQGFGRPPNPFQGGFGRQQPNPFQGFGRQQPNPFQGFGRPPNPFQGGFGRQQPNPFQGFGRQQPNPFQGGFGRQQPNPYQGGFGRQQPNPYQAYATQPMNQGYSQVGFANQQMNQAYGGQQMNQMNQMNQPQFQNQAQNQNQNNLAALY